VRRQAAEAYISIGSGRKSSKIYSPENAEIQKTAGIEKRNEKKRKRRNAKVRTQNIYGYRDGEREKSKRTGESVQVQKTENGRTKTNNPAGRNGYKRAGLYVMAGRNENPTKRAGPRPASISENERNGRKEKTQ